MPLWLVDRRSGLIQECIRFLGVSAKDNRLPKNGAPNSQILERTAFKTSVAKQQARKQSHALCEHALMAGILCIVEICCTS